MTFAISWEPLPSSTRLCAFKIKVVNKEHPITRGVKDSVLQSVNEDGLA